MNNLQNSPSQKISVSLVHLSLLGIILQELVWVHTYHSLFIVGQPPSNALRGLAMILPITLCIPLYLFNHYSLAKLPRAWGPIFIVWCLTTLLSLIIGLATHSETRYFAGDILRFITPWLSLWFSLLACKTINRTSTTCLAFHKRTTFVIGMIGIFSGLVVQYFGIVAFGYHLSGTVFLIVLPLALLSDSFPAIFRLLGVLSSVGAVLLCSKRTTLALGAFMLLVTVGAMSRQSLKSLTGKIVIGLVAAVALFAIQRAILPDLYLSEHLEKMIESVKQIVVEDTYDSSYGFRHAETENIQAFFRENVLMALLGVGFGGEIPMIYDSGETNQTSYARMHHVHKGFYLYFLRHGILGVLLLVLLSWKIVQLLLTSLRMNNSIGIWCGLYCFSKIIGAFSGNLMMEDYDLPLVLAFGYSSVELASNNSYI